MSRSQRLIDLLFAPFRSSQMSSYGAQIPWAFLRIVVGLFMIHNGLDKLADIEGFAKAYVEIIGLPFPIPFAYTAAFAELIGGPLVAVGFLTRVGALFNFATMAVADYHHILVAGFSVPYLELASIYAACFLFFLINGPGKFSFDTLIGNWLNEHITSQRDDTGIPETDRVPQPEEALSPR